MSRSPTVVVLATVVCLLTPPPVSGQASGTEPEPYDPTEFPQWAHDLRRAEIVALGAFPVSMIIGGLGYEIGRFAYFSVQSGSFRDDYAPGFLSPGEGALYTSNERIGLIVSGAILSVGVAVIDYILGRRERGTVHAGEPRE